MTENILVKLAMTTWLITVMAGLTTIVSMITGFPSVAELVP